MFGHMVEVQKEKEYKQQTIIVCQLVKKSKMQHYHKHWRMLEQILKNRLTY